MPTSVRDRLSCTYEVVYFLVRDRNYYFDLDTVRVPHRTRATRTRDGAPIVPTIPDSWRGPLSGRNTGLSRLKARGLAGHPLGKNPGDVWQLATAGYRGRHHAVFPEKLVELPLLATCPAKVCSSCGTPWARESIERLGRAAVAGTLKPSCDCEAPAHPGIVLDPFIGSGTVAAVARRHRRHWLGIELNPVFAKLAEARLQRRAPRRTVGGLPKRRPRR
jgi:site-specific DNA-methyltransferase (adenine-specific)